MVWFVLTFIIVVGLFPTEPAAQECSGTPFGDGFLCGTGPTGPVFTPSTALTPSPLLGGAIEQIQEEAKQEEETDAGVSADGQGFGFFVNSLTVFKDIADRREWGYNSETFGVSVGADYTHERFVVGAGLDYSHEDTDYNRDAGSTDADEFGLQMLGIAYPIEDLYIAGTARFAYNNYETERRNGAEGDPYGFKISATGGPGYDFYLQRGITIGLSGLLSWEWTHVDSYEERGGDVNLRYETDDIHHLTSMLELNGQKSFSFSWGVLIPEVVARYNHEWMNNPRRITGEAIGVTGNNLIRFKTNRPDRDYYNLGAALTAVLPGGPALFVNYHAELAHSYREEHVVNVGIRTSFEYLSRLAGVGSGGDS